MTHRGEGETAALSNINSVHSVEDRTFIREHIKKITNDRLLKLFSENEIAELFLFWLQCASCFHGEIPLMIAGVLQELWREPYDERRILQTLNVIAAWCFDDGKNYSHIHSMVGMIS